MAKKYKNMLQNSFYKGQGLKILCLVIVLYTLLLGMISADELSTNIITFEKTKDMKYGKVTITDSLTSSKLEEIELKDNTDYCLTHCSATKDIILYQSSALVDKVNFINMEGYIKNYKFYVQDGYKAVTVPDHINTCKNLVYPNGSAYIECTVKTSSHVENVPVWVDYEIGKIMLPGNYTLKLEGEKGKYDVIDWVITSQGKSINNWLIWNSSFNEKLLHYYDFDTVSSASAEDLIGDLDLKHYGSAVWVTGKRKYAQNYTKNTANYANSTANSNMVGAVPRTFNFWAKVNDYTTTTGYFLDGGDYVACGQFAPAYTSSKWYFFGYGGCNVDTGVTANNEINMHTLMYNGSKMYWYINATLIWSADVSLTTTNNALFLGVDNGDSGAHYNAYGGWIDELMIYNRTLSESEITDLYSAGSGLFYGVSLMTLNSPPDNSFLVNSVSFNCTAESSADALVNISLWHNATGVWHLNQSKLLTGSSNSTVFNLNVSTIYPTYKWNCMASTLGEAFFGVSNRTISTKFLEHNQSYSPSTTSASTETFKINISYDNSYYSSISAGIYYNKTYHGAIASISGNNIVFTSTFAVPFVVNPANNSFNWVVRLSNSTETTYYNSTTKYQYLNNLSMDNCAVYGNLTLNYTMYDELTQLQINSTYYNTSIEVNVLVYSLDKSVLLINYSRYEPNSSNTRVCLSSALASNVRYSMYSDVRYDGDLYVSRHNYIQNVTLGEITLPQNIKLLDLKEQDATRFLVTYKDISYLSIEGAIITIAKQYLGEGVYKTVEIEKTDENGQATVWIDTNGRYTFSVYKDGTMLGIFANVLVYCTNIVYGECTIPLNAQTSFIPVVDFENFNGLNYYEIFNQTTRTYSLIYSTINLASARIEVNLTKFDRRLNTSICYKIDSSSSLGQIDCTIDSSYGNITFIANIYKDGLKISQRFFTIYSIPERPFEGNVVFFALAIMFIIPIMFIPSAIGVIIGTIVGFGIAGVLFYLNGDYKTTLAISITTLIVAGMIIIYRLRTGGND